MSGLWEVIKQTFVEWQEDNVPRLGAALAFYSVFSLAPGLIITLALAGAIWGPDAAQGKLAAELETLIGSDVAAYLQDLADHIHRSSGGVFAALISGVLLFFGATGAVVGLKDALNTVWGVVDTSHGLWWTLLRDRLLSVALVLATGLLLLGSMLLTSFLQGMSERAALQLRISFPTAVIINWAVSLTVISLLFALIFSILPDVELGWRDVLVGSAVTSVLFLIGRELIAVYLGRFSFTSTYGTAGSLVAVLLWVYYSAQILLLGAEFTQVYARRYGFPIRLPPGVKAVGEVEGERE
ncbi:MAG: hypothetical protein B7Z73_04040 [Planctomycetia bacterium 21-64-5]|nr:MAG: hypothetical protein B7Z73_04040 [Planctomycetia bacterium 21-64-5]HQU42764.1 YihY/virulence factor BrkB family protein [Pirellulales bacterium]